MKGLRKGIDPFRDDDNGFCGWEDLFGCREDLLSHVEDFFHYIEALLGFIEGLINHH
jgi:hypothetical protein